MNTFDMMYSRPTEEKTEGRFVDRDIANTLKSRPGFYNEGAVTRSMRPSHMGLLKEIELAAIMKDLYDRQARTLGRSGWGGDGLTPIESLGSSMPDRLNSGMITALENAKNGKDNPYRQQMRESVAQSDNDAASRMDSLDNNTLAEILSYIQQGKIDPRNLFGGE